MCQACPRTATPEAVILSSGCSRLLTRVFGELNFPAALLAARCNHGGVRGGRTVKSLPLVNDGGYPPHPPELLADTVTADGRRRYCTYPFRLFGIASDILKPCTWLRQRA